MRFHTHALPAAATLATLLAVAPAARAIDPHNSWSALPTGNGYGFAVYDAQARKLNFLSNHPYASVSDHEDAHQLAYDAYFGVRALGGGAWLTGVPVDALEYVDQTQVVHATQSYGPLRAETYVLAPWDLTSPSVVLVLHVTNTARETLTDAAAYALLNFHLGAGGAQPDAHGEHITWDGATQSYNETGPSGLTLSYVPFGAAVSRHAATPNNPFAVVSVGGSLVNTDDSGVTDDAAAGFQWTFDSLAPGADQWVGVVVTLGGAAAARTYLASRDPHALLDAEVSEWNAWRAPPPDGLSPAESRVWRQSETVLRMAQSRETGAARGQIVAALPPGQWWIAWTRDQSYATAALARAGHRDEANAAVDFLAGAHVGAYRQYVGTDYPVSVVRYYGDGDEWSDTNGDGPNIEFDGFGLARSDTNGDGPNIEFDGFGLAPWAAHYVGRNELDSAADTLRHLVDTTGMIAPDSSIWEVHWNGKQKHFAYTSIAAANALCVLGDATTARSVRDAMVQKLILPTGGLAGNLEELTAGQHARDAAVVEAINFGLLDPHGALAARTVQEFERLRTAVGRGFMRNDDGGGYDSQEWVFIDLRVASALRAMGRTQDADELLAWVTAQADANYGLQAELYQAQTADYAGSVPMAGFGAGAYLLALLDRAHPEAQHTDCFPPEHVSEGGDADGGVGTGGSHGGCSVGAGVGARGVRGAWWAVVAMAVGAVLARRGRRRRDRGAQQQSGAGRQQNESVQRQNESAQRQNESAQRQNESAQRQSVGFQQQNESVPQRNAAFQQRNDSSRQRNDSSRRRNDSSRRRNAAFQQQNDSSRQQDRAVPQQNAAFQQQNDASHRSNSRRDRGTERGGGAVRSLALLALLALAGCTGGPSGSDAGDGGTDAFARVDAPPPVSQLPVRDCSSRFVYALGHQASSVAVAGDWNMFSQSALPMTDGLYSNVYRAATTLAPGSYAYKFVADGNWTLDPGNGMSAYVSGTENSRLLVPDCALPALQVLRADVLADKTIALDLQYVDGSHRDGMDPATLAITLGGAPLPASAYSIDAAAARISVRAPVTTNDKYTLRFDVKDRGGRAAEQLIVPMWVEDEPFQWTDGPLYFAFTDRFRDGNPGNDSPIAGVDTRANYQGGDLAGVLAALREGYFEQLGVRSIWLSPVNDNTDSIGQGADGRPYSAYHGYWVSAPRALESRFGTLDDLRAVTAEAHRRGIRIILDLAMNQLHRDHPYYAMHRDWFNGDGSCVCGGANCDWDTHRLDCWFTDYLPDVNWTNMAAVDQMIDDALYWLTEADVDGFRVDAVKHMQNIATTTLRLRIHERLESGNARYYLVGETYSGAGDRAFVESYVSDHQLWGQFDFPLFWSIRGAFADMGGTMGDLDGAVLAGESTYVNATMSPFLGNQDVPRFLSEAAGQLASDPSAQAWSDPPVAPDSDEPYDRLFLAYTFLLTQPGVPLIYYGDEIGMPGAADPDNRRMLRFGADLSARESHLLDRVRIVAHARGTHPGLRRGGRRTLYTDGDGYVYTRGADQDLAVIALNRGSTNRTVHVTVPPELAADGAVLRDLLGGPSVTVTGGAIDVPFTIRGAALYVR